MEEKIIALFKAKGAMKAGEVATKKRSTKQSKNW